MSERLLRGQFNELAGMTWDLARLNIRDLLQIAPADSIVKGEIHFDQYCVEPEVTVQNPDTVMTDTMPRHLGITVSEKEFYRGDNSLTMYTLERLQLDTVRRLKVYGRCFAIMDDEGRTITPAANGPTVSRLSLKEKVIWNDTINESLNWFGPKEAERFLYIADLALQSLSQSE